MPVSPPPWPIGAIDLWLGNQVTRTGQQLTRHHNESFLNYFSRWLSIKRFRLEWRVETFPEARPGKQTFYRPIVNGCELAACYCGEGENERAAKEAACKSLVEAIGCKL